VKEYAEVTSNIGINLKLHIFLAISIKLSLRDKYVKLTLLASNYNVRFNVQRQSNDSERI